MENTVLLTNMTGTGKLAHVWAERERRMKYVIFVLIIGGMLSSFTKDVIDQEGIEGQGQLQNPHSIFKRHGIVYISHTDDYSSGRPHYETSYGQRYKTLEKMDSVIAGYGYLDTPWIFGKPTFYLKKNVDDFDFPFKYDAIIY